MLLDSGIYNERVGFQIAQQLFVDAVVVMQPGVALERHAPHTAAIFGHVARRMDVVGDVRVVYPSKHLALGVLVRHPLWTRVPPWDAVLQHGLLGLVERRRVHRLVVHPLVGFVFGNTV